MGERQLGHVIVFKYRLAESWKGQKARIVLDVHLTVLAGAGGARRISGRRLYIRQLEGAIAFSKE